MAERRRTGYGNIDLCRARGCGGYLRGVGSEVHDGEIAYCASCGRMHTFHVAEDGADAVVEIERKPRTTPQPRARKRGKP